MHLQKKLLTSVIHNSKALSTHWQHIPGAHWIQCIQFEGPKTCSNWGNSAVQTPLENSRSNVDPNANDVWRMHTRDKSETIESIESMKNSTKCCWGAEVPVVATTCHSSRTHLSDSACKPTEVLSQREISLHDLGKPWKTLSNDLECGKNAFLTSPAPDLISIYFSTLVHLSKSTKLLALNDVSSQARARQTKNSPPASTFQSTGKISDEKQRQHGDRLLRRVRRAFASFPCIWCNKETPCRQDPPLTTSINGDSTDSDVGYAYICDSRLSLRDSRAQHCSWTHLAQDALLASDSWIQSSRQEIKSPNPSVSERLNRIWNMKHLSKICLK